MGPVSDRLPCGADRPLTAEIEVRSEQIYVVEEVEGSFLMGGVSQREIPWALLGGAFLYALDERVLERLLSEAARSGFLILDGAYSERRGLRGFVVALGAWGWKGRVECRTLDAWALRLEDLPPRDSDAPGLVAEAQRVIRSVCSFLNEQIVTFRPTALRWLTALYTRMGRDNEPGGVRPPPLPASVAMLCRQAHVGGPIVHVRTTLEPYVSLDRKRAYGEELQEELPSGSPVEQDVGHDGLSRWRPSGWMRALGVAEATIRVHPGPFVPLLPIMRWHYQFHQAKTLYPTGCLRGAWTLSELAYLERSGRGEVERMHRVVTFERARPFASMVRYIRRLEVGMKGIHVKRLEHMLYGSCASGLSVQRFCSARRGVHPLPSEIVDNRLLERLSTNVEVCPLSIDSAEGSRFPLYQVRGKLSEEAPFGMMDRPDRSACVTAGNRIVLSELIDRLDTVLGASRSGSYVGRVYVDGVDLEVRKEDLPDLPGFEIKDHGSRMRIYRAGVYVSQSDLRGTVVEDGGLSSGASSESDLERALEHLPDSDGGPFAGGRVWHPACGVNDPRKLSNRCSEPMHLDLDMVRHLGFNPVESGVSRS